MSRNPLLRYKNCDTISIQDFMEVMRHYDVNKTGTIDAKPESGYQSEVTYFTRDLLETIFNEKPADSEVETVQQQILDKFAKNNEKGLTIQEMLKILPVEQNFLHQFIGNELSSLDVDIIFEHYDKDGSGEIQQEEVASLVHDIMNKQISDATEREQLQISIKGKQNEVIKLVDKDGDGCIDRGEIRKVFKMYFSYR